MNKQNNTDHSKQLDLIYSEMDKLPIDDIVENLKPDLVSPEEVSNFLKIISDSHGITPSLALLGVSLLFLKGACNNSAPNYMNINLKVPNGEISITKYDLEYACHVATGNKYLRRIAQHLAQKICKYAETKNLPGDLAVKLNNMAIAKENSTGPLTSKEKAWACSFVQEVDNLAQLASPRLVALLAEDYNKNLGKKKSNNKQNKNLASTEQRKWRDGKKKSEINKKDEKEKNPSTTKPVDNKKNNKDSKNNAT